jgi:Uncharacterised protein family (UPF0193)
MVAVENEICERRAFLQEMERLGRGHEYRTIIETEISQVLVIFSVILTAGELVRFS